MDEDGINELYSRKVLDGLFEDARRLRESGKDLASFSAIQQSVMERHLTGFRYDRCITSVFESDSKGTPVSVDAYLHNFEQPDQEILDSYYAVADEDDVSKLIFLNPGWALSHEDVFLRPLEDEPVYKKHTKKFGVSKAFSIGFLPPYLDNLFLSFDYLGAEENMTWNCFDPQTLEWASFPFALIWLYLVKKIGTSVLRQHLTAMSDLRVSQLDKLRVYMQHHGRPLTTQAKILSIQPQTYKEALAAIRDSVLPQFRDDVEQNQRNKLALMQPYFELLKMTRDKSQAFQYLDGRPMSDHFERRMGRKDTTSPPRQS